MMGLRNSRRKILLLSLVTMACCFMYGGSASAEYMQHNLIDDTVFLDANSMSQAQIQNFLVARGSYLATYSSYSGRDGANVLASRIIYEAAQDYGINPKVILATLQKEQSLVTATNPSTTQLQKAMGYGCPDSAACNERYYGLYNQVDNGAWQFRKNFERARGNNSWWSSSPGYACGGITRYYSTGLYAGRNVTFYDDSGTSIQTFVLNNPSTASLYCYTPHPYNNPNGLYGNPAYGSRGQYYSGSYNFVLWFERWFGSTQPAVQLVSDMKLSVDPLGKLYTGSPTKVQFTLKNNTNAAVDIGQIGVAGYDTAGNNAGYPMRSVVIPAFGSYTYSESQALSREDTYHFWITSYNGNGIWSSSYPSSADISLDRDVSTFVQAMPQITQAVSFSPSDRRVGRTATVSFRLYNPSQQPVTLGKVGLAVYGPQGQNLGLPTEDVVIPAQQSYTYSKAQVWPIAGTYTSFLTTTKDNGVSWDSEFIAPTSGVQKQSSFTVGDSPTLTQSPALSTGSPRVGQQTTASFKVHNYSDTPINRGKIGLAIYGPQGQNVGLPLTSLIADANGDMVYSQNTAFYQPGTYTAWIVHTPDDGRTYDSENFPSVESGAIQRKITFTVLPSPTVSVEPAITPASPRVGQQVTVTYTFKNYGSSAVEVGKTGFAALDSRGANVGLALDSAIVPANGTYTYSKTTVFNEPGQHRGWITVTRDNGRTWDDTSYPVAEASVNRSISFNVLPNPTLTQSPALSTGSPRVGQQTTASFKVHNYSDTPINRGKIGLAIYGPQGQNVGLPLTSLIADANGDMVYSYPITFTTKGTYTAWITYTKDGVIWDDTTYPHPDSGSIQRRVTFTVE